MKNSALKAENPQRIVISGGGTGGHVFPAIAIADAIKEKLPEAELLFVGAEGKLEMEKVPKAGYPIEGLWISGFSRQLTWRHLLFPVKLLSSLWKAFGILRRFRPQVVVGVGGYASGPILEVAGRMGIPTLIQEQNSYAGVTNRLLAKKVRKICVAYPDMQRSFPADKLVLTGNPVRRDLLAIKASKEVAARHFELREDLPVLFVFGGSLGAQSLNEAMAANAALLRKHPEVQVLWQVGKLYYDRFRHCETARLPNVRLRQFIDRMDLAYVLAEVVVCRSGALTIAELQLVGKPVVFIPSPNVAEDHQTKNARKLVDMDAAVMALDSKAREQIIRKPLELLRNDMRRRQLATNIRRLAKPKAAEHIAEEVIKLLQP